MKDKIGSFYILPSLLMVCSVLVAGCGKEPIPNTPAAAAPAAPAPDAPAAPAADAPLAPPNPAAQPAMFKRGVEYVFYDDGSCNSSIGKECISVVEQNIACSGSPNITTGVVRMLGNSNSDFASLSSGGNVDFNYAPSRSKADPCLIFVTASGILRGTSTRITQVGYPTTFVLNESGDIVVTYVAFKYTQY